MKEYLIRIENNHSSEYTTIYGDCPGRPFSIANNLWNYSTPWHAAQRLEKLAKSWESNGHTVNRVYGSGWDMPAKGNEKNVGLILLDCCWIE